MTRTIFGRRQVVLRQRARQEAWRRALQVELESRTGRAEPHEETAEVVVASAGITAFRLRDPRD